MTPLQHTCEIVAAYVSHNHVQPSEMPALIRMVHSSMAPRKVLTPAVPVSESIGRKYITCLEDGKKQVSLKLHLKAAHGLTPEQYREKWRLPATYPMTAPESSDRRSANG